MLQVHAFEIILSNLILQVVIFMFRFGGGYAVPAGHTRIYWDVTKMVSEHGPRIMTAVVGLECHACGIYPEYSYV